MFKDILTVTQLLLIPAIVMMYKYMKRQITIARDIIDLKVYTKAICRELKIPCALKDD